MQCLKLKSMCISCTEFVLCICWSIFSNIAIRQVYIVLVSLVATIDYLKSPLKPRELKIVDPEPKVSCFSIGSVVKNVPMVKYEDLHEWKLSEINRFARLQVRRFWRSRQIKLDRVQVKFMLVFT